jgi:stage III sporulation protein AE
MDSYLEQLDMTAVEYSLAPSGISFGTLVERALSGTLDLSPGALMDGALRLMAGELMAQFTLMRGLFIIAILSALLKNLCDSFENKGVGELGFYVCYVALVGISFRSFGIAASAMQGLIVTLVGIMEAALPLMISLIVMTGNIGGAYAFHPLLVFAVNIGASLIKNMLVPLIMLGAGLHIVNYLTEHEVISKFADLVKLGASLSLKAIVVVFGAVLGLQRVSAPILDNLALRTAKSASGAVPVVGDMLSGAMDTVLGFAHAAKGGVSVAIIISVLTVCAVPVLRVLVLIAVYRFTAAAIQPICDKRISDCIDAIASFSLLLLGAAVSVSVMFLFAVLIMLSF